MQGAAVQFNTSARDFASGAVQTERKQTTKLVIKDWLERAQAAVGKKPTPFAKHVGLAPQTIFRALDPEDPSLLSTDNIDKIVKATGLPPPQLSTHTNGSAIIRGFAEPEMVQLAAPEIPKGLRPNSPNQSVWRLNTRGLELLGYLPGDLVLLDQEAPPANGDAVCAQIIDQYRGTAETVFRVFDPPYLTTETWDRKSRQKPLLIDNERVAVIGTITALLRLRA